MQNSLAILLSKNFFYLFWSETQRICLSAPITYFTSISLMFVQ